jgi:peroxiredoxin
MTTRLLIILAVALTGAALPAFATEPSPPALGQQVPPFELFDLGRAAHRLTNYQEPVIVLNFWAFWCDTWKAQLPQLCQLARQQRELRFRLLAVSIDGQWSDSQEQTLRDQRLPFPVLLDGQRTLGTALGLRRVPTVMVLNRERKVTWLHEAYPGNPAVLKAIRSALSN